MYYYERVSLPALHTMLFISFLESVPYSQYLLNCEYYYLLVQFYIFQYFYIFISIFFSIRNSCVTKQPVQIMRTSTILSLLAVVALTSSCVYAKRFSDAEKKLNAINSHKQSVEKWKKLYSLKPAAEQQAKQPLATVTKLEENNVSSGVKQQALKPSPPKVSFQQQQQQPQPNNKPVITKNPKEEKQKKERYAFFCLVLLW